MSILDSFNMSLCVQIGQVLLYILCNIVNIISKPLVSDIVILAHMFRAIFGDKNEER